ncbi:hypothetical protein [Tamilnaduibacter salinus]|nr:hypothetical protein [Tamilnaduibacter salinus]
MTIRHCLRPVMAALYGYALVPAALADLDPLSDQAMGEVRGQAMVAMDVTGTEAARRTRVTLGLDAEVQTNVDSVALGDTGDGSDVAVEHLSLGHISTDASTVQLDGQTYAVNEIVPFVGKDPYFEVAEQSGEVVGFRVGFNQARGTLSGDLNQFSGQLGLDLVDDSGTVVPATLFDGQTNATNHRATHVGIDEAGTDCSAGTQCAPLTNLKTLDVGDANGDGTVGFATDFFIGFQEQALDWQTPEGTVSAQPGVHLNLPTAMQLDLQTLQDGVPRARTEYIDRGQGLF